MMPRSHFMFGMLVSIALSYVFPELGMYEVLFGGFIATIVDIDHLVSYAMRHGNWNIEYAWDASTEHLESNRTRYVHSRYGLVIFGFIALGVYYFVSPMFAAIFYAAYLSHMIADFEINLRPWYATKIFTVGHFVYPITLKELIFDVFLFDVVMILLIHRGMIG